MKRVLADTGPIVAILSRRDQHHKICVEALRDMPGPLFTCWPVITEAAWLLRRDSNAIQRLLNSIDAGLFEMLTLTTADAKPISAIMKKYRDIRIQLADGCSTGSSSGARWVGHGVYAGSKGFFGVSAAEGEGVSNIADRPVSP
jgi:hypothetical protein